MTKVIRATRSEGWKRAREHAGYQAFALASTLLLLVIGWVLFRAHSWNDAIAIFKRIWSARPIAGWKPTPVLGSTAACQRRRAGSCMRTELTVAVHDLAVPAPLTFQNRGYSSLGGRVAPSVQETRSKGRAIAYADVMD